MKPKVFDLWCEHYARKDQIGNFQRLSCLLHSVLRDPVPVKSNVLFLFSRRKPERQIKEKFTSKNLVGLRVLAYKEMCLFHYLKRPKDGMLLPTGGQTGDGHIPISL